MTPLVVMVAPNGARRIIRKIVPVIDETGSDSSLPLYSWNGPAFGTHDATWATYR